MKTQQRWSRWVAQAALVSVGAIFAVGTLKARASDLGGLEHGRFLAFGLGLAVAFFVAARGLHKGRPWAPAFGAGLALFATLGLLPVSGAAGATVLGLLGVGLVALLAFALLRVPEPEADRWRYASLGFAGGLAVPFLLAHGALATGTGGLVAAAGLVGLHATMRDRTWGLFAMLAAVPLLFLDPCGGALQAHASGAHGAVGGAAGVLLLFAVRPFVLPALRFLRRG